MAREAPGSIRGGALAQRKSEALEGLPGVGFRARFSLGAFGRHRITIKHCTEREAEKRRDAMTDAGRLLVAAGHGARAKGLIEDMGAAVQKLKTEEARRGEVFQKSFDDHKSHHKVLERKFDELLKQAKENPDVAPPKKPFDFD